MNSNKPYLIRAYFEWIVDNDLTPFIVVDANGPHGVLPQEFIEDDKIVLNTGPDAVRRLSLGNELIEFDARFSGKKFTVSFIPESVIAIYAQENGMGIVFNQTDEEMEGEQQIEEGPTIVPPALKIIEPKAQPEKKETNEKSDTPPKKPTKKNTKKRPQLKVVK